MLTKPGDHLIETQVLEVYDELSMNKDKTYKVELEGNSGGPTLVKLDENEEKESMEEGGKKERLQLKLVDMGEMNFFTRPLPQTCTDQVQPSINQYCLILTK